MQIALPLLLALAPASLAQDTFDWTPLDDPGGDRLPRPVRTLHAAGQAYQDADGSVCLLVRHHELDEPIEGFMADEEAVTVFAPLIPLEESYFDAEAGEGLAFHCELTPDGEMYHIAALYAPRANGGLVSVWMIADQETSLEALAERAEALVPLFDASIEPPHDARQETILLDHHVSFALAGGSGDTAFALIPTTELNPKDTSLVAHELSVHPTYHGGPVRQWTDASRGMSLSFQVLQGDTGLGLKDPLIHHLAEALAREGAGQLKGLDALATGATKTEDVDVTALEALVYPEEGQVPIDLLHWDAARTRIVSDAEVERHYAANKMAKDAGVIIQVYLPRSPFARVTRMRWVDGEGEAAEHCMALQVELRSYPRSRSETIHRASVAIFRARAKSAEDLVALEESLGFESQPIEPGPFAANR